MEAKVQEATRKAAAGSYPTHAARLMGIMLEHRFGDPGEFAGVAGALHTKSLQQGDYSTACHYADLEADFHGRNQNDEARAAAQLKGAETALEHANQTVKHGSYLGATDVLRGVYIGLQRLNFS